MKIIRYPPLTNKDKEFIKNNRAKYLNNYLKENLIVENEKLKKIEYIKVEAFIGDKINTNNIKEIIRYYENEYKDKYQQFYMTFNKYNYNLCYVDIEFYGERLETDEDYNKRMKNHKSIKQDVEWMKSINDYNKYLELKNKYENNSDKLDYGTKELIKLLDKVKNMSIEEYNKLFEKAKEEYKMFNDEIENMDNMRHLNNEK